MTDYVVAHQFIHGEWTYREGESFTAEALTARGMDAAAITYAQRRGGLVALSEAAPAAEVAATTSEPPTLAASEE